MNQIGNPQKTIRLSDRWRGIILGAIVALSILLPRAFGLDRFVTADEPTWMVSTANFYYALGQRDFQNTYQLEHPGVTLMWAGTAGFLWQFPGYRGIGLDEPIDVYTYEDTLLENGYDGPEKILAAGRFFLVLGVTLVLTISFFYAQRLIGVLPALAGFLLIAFDPYHIGLSRLFILDGTLSSLMLLSVLVFLCFLRDSNPIDLVISGFAAGLSWLTKSPGFFLIPIVGLLAALNLWQLWRASQQDAHKNVQNWNLLIRQRLWQLMIWGILGIVVFFIFWPAMWVDPIGSLAKMFERAFGYVVSGHKHQIFFDGEIVESGNLGLSFFQYYPLIYLWHVTPVTLIGLLAAFASLFIYRKSLKQKDVFFTILLFVVYIVSFILLMTLGGKKMARYILPSYIVLELIAALGFVVFIRWFLNHFTINSHASRKSWLFGLFIGIFLISQIGFALEASPYYLTYFNPLLGGIRKAADVLMIGWGEGLEQAADYLNHKPDAENLQVVSWYERGCFSYYFDGQSRIIPIVADLEPDKLQKFITEMDYAVIYIQQRQRQTPQNLLAYLEQFSPEHIIWIDGVEYIRIYNLQK